MLIALGLFFLTALVLSLVATWSMIHIAPRLGLVDKPSVGSEPSPPGRGLGEGLPPIDSPETSRDREGAVDVQDPGTVPAFERSPLPDGRGSLAHDGGRVGHKTHRDAKPLGGGVAITAAFVVTLAAGLLAVYSLAKHGVWWDWYAPKSDIAVGTESISFPDRVLIFNRFYNLERALLDGVIAQLPLALTFLAAVLGLHILGLLDDRKPLGPFVKLFAQLAAAAAVVLPFEEVRVLTALGTWPSVILSILWIGTVTNAFNFLDNMDGLAAGVAAVCTTAFLVTAISIEQWFVAATLAVLLGSVLGFLVFNFPPARIFMGDSGSLVVGFVLGVLTVRTTFLPPDQTWGGGWYAVFAPLIVLALPLYDFVTVSVIRIRRGKSPFVGDTNHFSHRLVARGMSRRTAVLCCWLVAAATSIAAIVLPHVQSTFIAMLVIAQTFLILGVVALLEQHKAKKQG